jgi:hypothetical protein
LATFTNHDVAQKYGPLFEAAPELQDALALALPYVEEAASDPSYKPGPVRALARRIRALI